jgi:hypothetical protein
LLLLLLLLYLLCLLCASARAFMKENYSLISVECLRLMTLLRGADPATTV